MEYQDLGKQIDKIEPNRLFSLKWAVFLILCGFIGVYYFFYGTGSKKMALFLSCVTFGLAIFFLTSIKNNWVRIYENGLMVSGAFTRSGIFSYDQIDCMEIERKKSGFPSVNVSVYDSTGKMITAMTSFFYKDLPEKVEQIKKIKVDRQKRLS